MLLLLFCCCCHCCFVIVYSSYQVKSLHIIGDDIDDMANCNITDGDLTERQHLCNVWRGRGGSCWLVGRGVVFRRSLSCSMESQLYMQYGYNSDGTFQHQKK